MWSPETKTDLQPAFCPREPRHTRPITPLTSSYSDACRWKNHARTVFPSFICRGSDARDDWGKMRQKQARSSIDLHCKDTTKQTENSKFSRKNPHLNLFGSLCFALRFSNRGSRLSWRAVWDVFRLTNIKLGSQKELFLNVGFLSDSEKWGQTSLAIMSHWGKFCSWGSFYLVFILGSYHIGQRTKSV